MERLLFTHWDGWWIPVHLVTRFISGDDEPTGNDFGFVISRLEIFNLNWEITQQRHVAFQRVGDRRQKIDLCGLK